MDTSAWSFVSENPAEARLLTDFSGGFDPSGAAPDLSALDLPEEALIAEVTPIEWQSVKALMSAAFDPYALKALGTELFTVQTQWIRDRLVEISCPVTVIVGDNDRPFVDQAHELAAETRARSLTVIAGAYRSPQLTHPAEWTQAVSAHLASL